MRPRSQSNRRLRIRRTARAVTGGCKVLENPDRRGDEAVLFWRSELLVDLVRLIAIAAPAGTNSQLRFDHLPWAGHLAALATDAGLHLILRPPGDAEHRLLLPGPDPPRDGSPLAIVIEPNRYWRPRVAAAERFLAMAARLPIRPRPLARTSPEEVARRMYMLWAVDLEQAGASEHEVGALVFGTRVSGAIWSNHADRSELRRLLRAGRGFVSGRYRELLQARHLR
jgi:hypothetical protein